VAGRARSATTTGSMSGGGCASGSAADGGRLRLAAVAERGRCAHRLALRQPERSRSAATMS
jgi:hypothetical protein